MLNSYMSLMNREQANSSRVTNLKKPFGFCCDICYQDPKTQYDMRNPPFKSSFGETPLITNCPDIQFRVEDSAKTPPALVPQPIDVHIKEDVNIKKASTYGRFKRGRGSLPWFLEDEIEAARDILAQEKKAKWEEMHEIKINKPKMHRISREPPS